MFADLPVGEPDPVERARLIREQLAALKASREGVAGDTLTKLSGFAPATFLALGQRAAAKVRQGTINSVVSNVPGPQVPLYALGRKVQAAYPSPPIFPVGARMGVAVFSYNGGLHFGLIADYSTVPDLHVLRDGIRSGLDEPEATGAAVWPAAPSTCGRSGRSAPTRTCSGAASSSPPRRPRACASTATCGCRCATGSSCSRTSTRRG